MENYTVLKKLGNGSFAKVYLAVHNSTKQKVALKVIKKNHLSGKHDLWKRLNREIGNLELLDHKNIVKYVDHFETNREIYIAMEYVSGGELFDYVANKEGLSEEEARTIFRQIAQATSHMHKNQISHRDLKLENILVDGNNNPKIADFGFSKTSHSCSMLATYCGSPLYASPEMILGRPYKGPECDIWSLGVILYAMLSANMPFDDRDWMTFVSSIETASYPELDGVSKEAKHLISRMLDPNGNTRATIDEVLSHSWVTAKTRKASLELTKRRRIGVSHSSSAAMKITNEVLAEVSNHCSCSCHQEPIVSRDSAVSMHCSQCEPVTPTSPHTHKHPTISTSSSGYSSSTDSLNSPTTRSTTRTSNITETVYSGRTWFIKSNNDDTEMDLVFA